MVQEVNFYMCGLCASSSVAFQALTTFRADRIQLHCVYRSMASKAINDTPLMQGQEVFRGFHLIAIFLFPSTESSSCHVRTLCKDHFIKNVILKVDLQIYSTGV